jgi:hypothetical protein
MNFGISHNDGEIIIWLEFIDGCVGVKEIIGLDFVTSYNDGDVIYLVGIRQGLWMCHWNDLAGILYLVQVIIWLKLVNLVNLCARAKEMN